MSRAFSFNLKHLLLIISFCFLVNDLSAQERKAVVLYGKSNVPNLTVQLLKSTYGTSANIEGEFSLRLPRSEEPFKIQFSSIGYQDTLVEIDLSAYEKDSLQINIELKTIDYELSEVEISADRAFLKLRGLNILDFIFVEDHLLVLASAPGKRVLCIATVDGSFVNKIELSAPYESLYIDCFQSLFMISAKEVIQIDIDEKNLDYFGIKRFSRIDFERMILPCQADVGEYIVTSNFSMSKDKVRVDRFHNKRANFFYFDKQFGTDSMKYLTSVFDEESYKVSASVYGEIIGEYYKSTPKESNLIELGVWDGNIWKLYNGDLVLLQLISGYIHIDSKSAKFFSYKIGDEFFIVDIPNERILTYNDSLKMISRKKIKNKGSNHSINSLLLDGSTDRIYTLVEKEPKYILRELDVHNALIVKEAIELNVKFPIKIAIHDQKVYYATFDEYAKTATIERKRIE